MKEMTLAAQFIGGYAVVKTATISNVGEFKYATFVKIFTEQAGPDEWARISLYKTELDAWAGQAHWEEYYEDQYKATPKPCLIQITMGVLLKIFYAHMEEGTVKLATYGNNPLTIRIFCNSGPLKGECLYSLKCRDIIRITYGWKSLLLSYMKDVKDRQATNRINAYAYANH